MQPNVCTIRKVKDDMTTPAPPRPPPKNGLPPEIMEIILPALQVGGLSGASGVFIGTFAGIIRSNTPVLFAMASGIQWFTLGTSFTLSRNVVLHAWGKDKVTPQDKISASAIGGGVGGTVGGLLRGRGNIIPGAIVFALFGASGQYFYNRADARRSNYIGEPSSDRKGSWLNSKWSPMKVLSDKEYGDMLQEKLLRVNAEIALVDESIENLRVQEQEMNKTVESQNKSGAR